MIVSPAGAITDGDVLLHVGDPMREQRALVRGTAVAPRAGRAVVAVTGVDRLSWLDSITTQALAQLAPGVSTELLVLDPQGRVEHAASVLDDGETTWLIADAGDAPALATWLNRMRFRLRVEVRDASTELAVVGATDAGLALIRPVTVGETPLVWRDPWPAVAVGGAAYGPIEEHPGTQRSWNEALVDAAEASRLAQLAASGDIGFAGELAVEALRVAAWRPRFADEVDERTIPHELDWLRTAVHLDKGCYRGQETVAKVHNLGHPPRRLVSLHLDGSAESLPARGDAVTVGDTEIGRITSAARHFEDGPIALAVIKRTADTDTDVVVRTADGEVAASVTTVVPPDAGASAGVPRLPRLSRRR